jgi:large subunit ribosomal protein L19
MALSAKHNEITFTVADTVRVHHSFKAGDKIQTQVFEGVVMGIRGRLENKTFTVRKISFDGVGVEKIWSLNNPSITKITVKKKGTARRAKLTYLRSRIGKLALKAGIRETSKS